MAEAGHLITGRKGEEMAAAYLLQSGYRILERNWRFQHLELDIIALDAETLVIIEVKTRKENDPLLPRDLIPQKKQRYIIEATDAYIRQTNTDREVRFDVILIHTDRKKYRLEHIRKAFYPT